MQLAVLLCNIIATPCWLSSAPEWIILKLPSSPGHLVAPALVVFNIFHMQHVYSANFSFCQGGCVFIRASEFVSMITQELLNLFSQNSVERWHMAAQKKPVDFDGNMRHITLGLG